MKGKNKALLALLAALCMGTAVGFAACDNNPSQGNVNDEPHVFTDADGDGLCDECGKEKGEVKDPAPEEAKHYVVTFDTKGGSSVAKQGVKEGEKATSPEAPVKDGYVFDGWYEDEGCETVFDFDKAPDKDVTVYAKWKDADATADTYFDFEDVDGGVAISAKAGETLPQDVVLPSVHGSKAVVAIKSSAFEQQPAMRAVKIPASIRSIGQYAFRNCTALETVGGGENLGEVGYGAFTNTAWDLGLTVGEVYLGKTLYKYAGSIYTDTQITIKDGTVGISAGAFEGLTHLVGITLPETVKTVGSQAFAETGLLSVTVKSADAPDLGNTVFGAAGAFTGRIFVPADALSSYREASGWKAYADKIYAAGTAEQTYVVTFSAEGAENVPAAQNVKGFGKATQPEQNPSKDGYDFGGWFMDEDCTVPFDFSSEIVENLTLYAQFGKYYTVNFSTGEGASSVEAQRIAEGGTAKKPTQNPTKEGADFMGWYRDEACTKEFDWDAPITGETTVYAKFLAKGANYTGTGDYEGWVIENGALKSYTGSKTDIKIPKELTRLDSIAQLNYDSRGGKNQIDLLKSIKSITVEDGSTAFKVVNNTLMSYDGTVIYYCYKASTLKYPDAVKIAPYAFAGIAATGGANYMTAFGFSDNLIEVGEYAFYEFTALNGAYDSLFGSVEKVGKYAFYDNAFETIYCNAKYVGASAFEVSGNIAQQYTKIKEIRLPNIVTIESKAFAIQVSGLASAKGGCKKIVIGPNCKTIGAGAFTWNVQKCDLDVIILGDTLPVLANASLGNTGNNNNQYGTHRYVYVKESKLDQAKHENSYLGYYLGFYTEDGWGLREDGSYAFYEGDMTSLTMPAAVKSLESILDIFTTTANLDKCTSFAVAQESENFKMQDGALVSKDGKTLYAYFGAGTGNFSEVTEVKPYAFYNRLKADASVTFGAPETVGEYAFYGCAGLTSFTPFENLAEVAAHAFEKSGLTSATLKSPELTAIGEGAFAGCTNLKLYFNLLTPPTLPAKAVDATCELYVPQEIVETYTSAWSSYAAQVKADENTHVYTVTFDTDTENGGTAVESQQYLTGGKVVRPETDPTKTGYYFDGWYTKNGADGDWGTEYDFANSNVTASVTIYAKWTKGVNVTYSTGDSGAEVEGEMVRPGSTLTQPEAPKWSGHVFLGWYKDESCSEGQEFDFTKDTITQDTTLYAKWESGKVVTFSTGDGGSSVEEQSVLPGEKVTRPAENPTRPGYKFVDWYTKDGTEGDWGEKFDFENYKMGSEDLTIYAKWEEDFWQVDETGKLTKYYGPTDTVVLPATVKSITSILDIFGTKTVLGKCTSFTVAGDSDSFKMQSGALLSYDGTTLYAFFGDEGTELTWADVTAIGESAFYGHLATAKTLAFSKDLATVGKGAFESCAGMTDFTPFENVATIGADAFKSTKLVDIVWNGTTVPAAFASITTLKTVKFMKATTVTANAFTGSSAIEKIYLGDKMKTIGQAAFYSAGNGKHRVDVYVYATTPPTLYKTSSVKSAEHPFGGDGSKTYMYFHVPSSALTKYRSSSLVNWNWYTPAATRYVAITVNVTYHMGEGEGAPAAPTAAVNWGATFNEPTTPKWKGKIFAGWYTDADCSEGNEYTGFGAVIKEESLELWAKWEEGGLWVEFNSNEGSSVDWQALRSGEKATQPDAPTRAGYEFLGWYTKDGTESGDWGDQFNFESEITQNTTLYAKWEKGALVTFDLNGGSKPSGFVATQTVKKGEHVTAPAKNPTRTGWTFEGWWTQNGTDTGEWGKQFDFDEDTVSEDTTLYAKWNPWVLDDEGYLKSYGGTLSGTLEIPANIKIKDITAIFGTSTSKFPATPVIITVADGNTNLKVVGSALVSYDGTTLYYYFGTEESFSSTDITTIAPYAFAVNSKLESKDTLTGVTLSKVTAIPAYCFYNRGGLETLSFGTLTEIGGYSFNNAKVASFDLFKDLTAIPDYAFSGAIFTEKEITVNAATIGTMAFYKTNLTKLTLGENVTSIASNGFNGIANGGIVIFNGTSVPTVDKSFPIGNGGSDSFIGLLVVPQGKIETYKTDSSFVTAKLSTAKFVEAGSYDEVDGGWVVDKSGKLLSFYGDLATIVIPAAVKSMDSILDIFGAGKYIATCKSLTVAAENTSFKVENEMLVDKDTGKIVYMYLGTTAPEDLSTFTEIKPYAFYNKTAITSVTLTAVTKIGDYAFYGCSALKTITIGESVTEIGSSAFGSVPTGTTCAINATTPPKLGTNVFGTTSNNITVKVPSASVDAYKAESSWSLYKSRVIAQS